MKQPILAANWKMNKNVKASLDFVSALIPLVEKKDTLDIVICPPSTSLYPVCEKAKGTNIAIGSQNIFWENNGAYTGEVSPVTVKDMGCMYTLIGHSERRQFFSETNEQVNKKVKNALLADLKPIICVGESLKERDDGVTFSLIEQQIRKGVSGLTSEGIKSVVFAYEPIWAIGTGRNATPKQANEVHLFISETLSSIYSEPIASSIRILYGGSVKPENIKDLISEPGIDGALVGGASLEVNSFAALVEAF